MSTRTFKRLRYLSFLGGAAAFVVAIALMVSITFQAAGSLQLGGWLSSKLLERDGVADSQLLLVRDGVTDSFLTLVTAPTLATVSATNLVVVSGFGEAALNGTLSSLNGMPSADVGFTWGYSPSSMPNLTSTVARTETGAYTITLSGFDPTLKIYYRAVGTTDGVNYGSGEAFVIGRDILNYPGFEQLLVVTPVVLWVAAIIGAVLSFSTGIRQVNANADTGGFVFIGIGVALLAVALMTFPILLDALQIVRINFTP